MIRDITSAKLLWYDEEKKLGILEAQAQAPKNYKNKNENENKIRNTIIQGNWGFPQRCHSYLTAGPDPIIKSAEHNNPRGTIILERRTLMQKETSPLL